MSWKVSMKNDQGERVKFKLGQEAALNLVTEVLGLDVFEGEAEGRAANMTPEEGFRREIDLLQEKNDWLEKRCKKLVSDAKSMYNCLDYVQRRLGNHLSSFLDGELKVVYTNEKIRNIMKTINDKMVKMKEGEE